MIAVKENAEYQVGFEVSQAVGQLRVEKRDRKWWFNQQSGYNIKIR